MAGFPLISPTCHTPSPEDHPFDGRILQTIKKSLERVHGAHHFFFIIFCRRDDKIELFVVHFRVETTAPVNQGFHLGTHRVEIDGCCHDDNICCHHLINDLWASSFADRVYDAGYVLHPVQ